MLHRLTIALGILLAGAAVTARGATVRTVDDKTTSGTIKGFDHGQLLLQTQSKSAAVVKLPLEEIVEISIRPVARTKLASTPRATWSPSHSIWSAIGNLLGGSSAASPAVEATPESSDQPAADDTASPDNPTASAPTAAEATIEAQLATREFGQATTTAPVSATSGVAISGSTGPSRGAKPALHASGPRWQVEFVGGDHIRAELKGWTGTAVSMALDARAPSDAGAPFSVPADHIRAIWSANAALVRQAQAMQPNAGGQDLAFIEKDGKVRAVAGVVAGIEGQYLLFEFEGAKRRIKLERLVGLKLAQRETAPETALYQTCLLVDGDVLSGRIDAIAHDDLLLKPLAARGAAAPAVAIPLAQLAAIEIKNGRLIWLDDLHPAAVAQVPYFDRLMPYRVNRSLSGGPLVLADGPIAHGIAVHSQCMLSYDIDGAFSRFRAKVGFQQPEGKAGVAPVRILGDGKTLWQKQKLAGTAPKPESIDLDVSGVKRLVLEADFGPGGDVADRIVWGEARLVKPPPKP